MGTVPWVSVWQEGKSDFKPKRLDNGRAEQQ